MWPFFLATRSALNKHYVPPQSVCFVQDAVCLQQGSSQNTNPMVNFGQLKTVVVKYSHMPGTLFHAYEGPVHLPYFACLAARPTRLVPSFAFSSIWGPTRFQLFTANLPPGFRVCTHNFGPVFLICASCWGRSNMIYPLCLPSACIQRTKKTFFLHWHTNQHEGYYPIPPKPNPKAMSRRWRLNLS